MFEKYTLLNTYYYRRSIIGTICMQSAFYVPQISTYVCMYVFATTTVTTTYSSLSTWPTEYRPVDRKVYFIRSIIILTNTWIAGKSCTRAVCVSVCGFLVMSESSTTWLRNHIYHN